MHGGKLQYRPRKNVELNTNKITKWQSKKETFRSMLRMCLEINKLIKRKCSYPMSENYAVDYKITSHTSNVEYVSMQISQTSCPLRHQILTEHVYNTKTLKYVTSPRK